MYVCVCVCIYICICIWQTDIQVIQFPDDRNRDGPQNIGLLAIHHVMQLLKQENFIEGNCDYMHKLTVYVAWPEN